MGLTSLPVKICHPADAKKSKTLKFLIDSGAVYSVVPSTVLAKLGIKPDQERDFILANGQTVKRKLGGANFMYKGKKGVAPVIFGLKEDSTLLGATTLEAMGFVLNPFQRELLPLPMVLG